MQLRQTRVELRVARLPLLIQASGKFVTGGDVLAQNVLVARLEPQVIGRGVLVDHGVLLEVVGQQEV